MVEPCETCCLYSKGAVEDATHGIIQNPLGENSSINPCLKVSAAETGKLLLSRGSFFF